MSKICLVWNFSVSALSWLTVLSASTRPLAPTPSRSAWRNFSRDALSALVSASTSGCVAFSLAILPRPTAASRATSTSLSFTSLMSVSVHFGSASARERRRHELAHAVALVARERRELVERDQARELLGVERREAVEPLHLRQVAEPVLGEDRVERRRLLERDERPGRSAACRCCRPRRAP